MKLVVSGTLTNNGTISADGGDGAVGNLCCAIHNDSTGGGSGGSVWITTGTISGSGSITAKGGNSPTQVNTGGTGGGGRIVIDPSTSDTYTGSIITSPGYTGYTYGEIGTIVRDTPSSLSNLTIASNTEWTGVVYDMAGNLGSFSFNVFTINSGVTLTGDISLSVADLLINSTAVMSANGKGYSGGSGIGTNGVASCSLLSGAGGGGYGGAGGAGNSTGATGGTTYGSSTIPIDMGSSGGMIPFYDCSGGVSSSKGGIGGGYIKLIVSGTLTNNGTISADGNNGAYDYTTWYHRDSAGGGSGGSINITTNIISGSGSFYAKGGNATTTDIGKGGGGGGGRMSFSFNSTSSFSPSSVTVAGGTGYVAGGIGTINGLTASSVINTPTSNALLNSLSTVSGTAVDYGGGTLSYVDITLQRASDSYYYNGLTWDASEHWLRATGTSTWSYSIANNTSWVSSNITVKSRATSSTSTETPGSGTTFTFDNVGPTVTLYSATVDPTNGTIAVTATFSESVADFVVGDITVTNGTAGNFTGSGTTYTFTVTPTTDGTVAVDIAGGVATDTAGNANIAATQLTRVYDITIPLASTITAVCTVGGNGCTSPGQAASPQEIYSVQSISGTATDNVGGSGIGSVKISIKDTDVSVDKWYSGTSFTDVTETYITTTGTNTWSFDSSTVPLVIDHIYLIHIKSIDSALNEESPVQSLLFKFVNSPPVVSNVTASMASSGVVTVGYDVTDVESSQTTNYLYYLVDATLDGTITSGATSLTVSDAIHFPSSGTILIDDEMISYASKSGNILQTLTRGALSTTAAAHTIGASIYLNAASATGTGIGLSNKGTGKVITWTASTDADGYENATETIKVVANDGSSGSMIGSLDSASFIFDAKKPTAVVTFDAGSAGVVDSAIITIPMPTDISAIEYLITDGASEADATTSGWTSITTSTTIPWTFDSDIEIKNLKYQYRDAYGNTTPETITSTLSPILASSFLVQDTSNITIPSYDMYIGWKALVDTTGFASYNLEYAISTDNVTYGAYASVGDSMSNPVTNYYVHRNLDSTKFYRYRLGVVGTDGNTSIRAGAFTTAKPDGVQNYGEGGGGSVATASKVENVVPMQDAITKDVTITYRLTDTSLAQKTSVSYEARVFYNIGITLPANAYSGGNLTVSDASKLQSSGYIQINNEVIQYTGKTGNILTGLTRGTWPTAPRATRQNLTFFAGTPVWVMATTTTPTAITNTTISTGQDGSITWTAYGESALAGSSYTNVGVRVLVHDNQDPGVGPLSSQNDYSENGILNTFDLTAPTITFSAASSTGAESATPVNFVLTLARAYPINSFIDYTVSGTAVGGGVDYTLANGTATITAGETTTSLSAIIIDDLIKEGSETIIVTLTNLTGATLGVNTIYTYTITDNDNAPTIGFTTTESSGLESALLVNIPVSISEASGTDITVNYAVTGGTATGSGTDYTLASGIATITAGETTTNISVTVVDDAIYESNETIEVTLSSPSGATLGTNTVHTYTITDDDIASTIAFDATTSSGLESVTSVTIPVSLSFASYQDITVGYAVTGGTATGGGIDYTLASGTATITAGNTTTNISVTLVDDSLKESSETIEVTLSSPGNATLGTNTVHTYTITDDDSLPTIAFTSTSGTGAESVTPASIELTLSEASGLDTTVYYSILGTATGSGTDYTLASGTATITAGQTTANISLVVVDDSLSEISETVILTLSSPTNSTLGTNTVYTYTITDDDTDPAITFTVSSSSGLESVTPVSLEVSIPVVSSKNITVGYAVTGGTATSGVDYVLASGTATITAGSTTTNISMIVVDDSLKEASETVIITLTSPGNSTLGTNTTYTYIITDNEPDLSVAFVNTTSSGLESVTSTNINLALSSVSTQEATVNYAVTGTATGGGVDYTLADGIVTFTANTTTAQIPITIVDDSVIESNETIIITLSSPVNAALGVNTIHTYTILNDDADTVAPVITLTQVNGLDDVTVIKDSGSYVDAGATIIDATDGVCTLGSTSTNPTAGTCVYSTSGIVNTTAVSATPYTFTYTARDSSGNILSLSRLVTVSYASEYTITVTVGLHGSVSPISGPVASQVDHTFTITPDVDYKISSLLIDGTAEVPTTPDSYVFTNVVANHTLAVTFSLQNALMPIITLLGDDPMNIYTGDVFADLDPGATAVSGVGDPLVATRLNTVDTSTASTLNRVTYSTTDADGNITTKDRIVNVLDIVPPVITDVAVPVITNTAAAITWTTNEPATSQVSYGTATGSLTRTTIIDNTKSIYHVVTLSSSTDDMDGNPNLLVENVPYFYTVSSIDTSGNPAVSSEETFTTVPVVTRVIVVDNTPINTNTTNNPFNDNTSKFIPDVTAPVVSDLKIDNITAFEATVNFTTDEETLSFVEYGKTSKYGDNSANNLWSTEHSIKLRGLRLGTDYHIKVTAVDKSGNSTSTEDQKFKTKFFSENPVDLTNVDNVQQFQDEIEATIESILPALIPPFIEEPKIIDITENSATISFRTNIKTFSVVGYVEDGSFDATKSNPYLSESSDTSEKTFEHKLMLLNLKSNMKYHLQAKAFSLPQVVGKSEDITFTTKASKINGSIIQRTKDSFVVVWNTDVPTSSMVEYKNLKSGEKSRIIDSVNRILTHSIRVENLTPGTSYEVKISGVNDKGNVVEGNNILKVTTLVDVTPPAIANFKVESSLVVGRTDRVQTIVSWQTDEPSTSTVYYEEGSGSPYKSLANKQQDLELTINHVVVLTTLKPGTVYRFTVESLDDAGNRTKPPIRTIITPKKAESIVDVIFKNFNETFNFLQNVK